MSGWTANTREEEISCAGCGGTCDAPPDTAVPDAPLGTRSVILGSIGFFLGPIVLAITAAALFDDGGLAQLAATAGALVVGMAAAWLVGRVFGFSHEEPQ